ncbi:MAG: SMI1/KNR4 family protein [Saccharospirillaceae bacterium]|nr:SMI1/KNR4 family protein [Pseudomonadales bacterium]NRB80438.1 SMI1/KNR4 family protein [Saccharospirillaceae bacterium]
MEKLTDLLEEIEGCLQEKIVDTFYPAVVEEDIMKIVSLLNGEKFPVELLAVLKWHNGQVWNSEFSPENNRRLMSSKEIIETISFYIDPMSDFLEPWDKSWIPILTNDSSDYLVYVTKGIDKGKLIGYWHNDEDRIVEYKSLNEWANELILEIQGVA